MIDKNGKKENGSYQFPEILHAIFTAFSSAGFVTFIVAILAFTKSIEFKIENVFYFMLFVFVLAVALGTFVYMSRVYKKRADIKAITDAAEKICSGQYDIVLPELGGDFKKAGKSLSELAEHLKKAEEANNDFINDFSHELKTPIVSIRGFAKLLLKGNLSEAEQKEFLELIASESDRLIDLTAGTLLLDRLDNNRIKVESKIYNLSEQLRRQILMLQGEWEKKNIDIEADFTEYFIVGNEELISQMLLNILQNAVKFTPAGGKIKISVREDDKSTTVLVSDNGIGMDEDTRRRMFDKYFRGDKSRSTPGNGLGLATVKKIAEVTGAKLKVDSVENRGTDFYVTFKK
ncbi:MAG: HAMP domain-containing histidine kinase [Clostridia bacterium]|nr:HAMP domain-containing histidine kinase [Clostridia bacterium]